MKQRRRLAFFILFSFLLTYIAIGFLIPQVSLKLTEYEIASSKLSQALRVVQIADFHCAELDERVYEAIRTQKPDLIFVVGDLVNRDDAEIAPALDALETMVAFAPVYVSLGNHDVTHSSRFHPDLAEQFRQTGATVLDKEYVDIDVNGQALRIGGIYGYCLPEKFEEAWDSESHFLSNFQNTDRYTILLAHMPVCWLINDSLDYWDVDCVLSGHTHGGQVILPIIGGLYAPDQGWFPGACAGHFQTDNKHLIITTGLGGTTPVPRFYNRPEVVISDIYPVH